jgi:sugar diacid utilization regulator
LPHYRGISGVRLAEVRRSVLHHLALFYRVTLETGRSLTTEDLEPSRRLARRRAGQGVPLGEFLTFFQIGLTVIWEHLMADAGRGASLREQLLDRVHAIISNQTQLMTALVEAYVEERERLSRFREHDIDDFFQLLLAGDATDAVLEARAESLGIPLGDAHTVAIFGQPEHGASEGADAGWGEARERLAEGRSPGEVWLGRVREGLVALFRGGSEVAVEAARGLGGRHVGVGSAGRGVEALRRSASEALRALRIGALARPAELVHAYPELAVLDLVHVGSAGAEAFMRSVLGPLVEAGARRTSLETLRQLVAHGHRIKLAAAALSVHPHTLTYRLKQIRRRFGIDLDDPQVRLRVHLALLLLDARGAVAEGGRAGRRGRLARA